MSAALTQRKRGLISGGESFGVAAWGKVEARWRYRFAWHSRHVAIESHGSLCHPPAHSWARFART
ncbi:MAG TPA: hypothetical protein VGW38_26775, partial [Chloroflexota bacterium]|nr:hypothetical protein [Chloroflexota bacterium]